MTDDHARALSHVCEALRAAPAGARGLVHRVAVSFSHTGYFYEGLVARCQIDPGSGAILWDEVPWPASWGNLAPLFTDPSESNGDAIPPEAISAGLADLRTHRKRLQYPSASYGPDAVGPGPWA